LAYIAASAEKAGYRIQVVDAIGEAIHQYGRVDGKPNAMHYGLSFAEIVNKIDPGTHVIGLSILFSREWLLCRALALAIRERFPAALIVAGGEHITACAEYSLADCGAIDVAVLGEGEATFVDILRVVEAALPITGVPGVVCRDGASLIRTGARPRIRNIDSLPDPAWHLFPLEEYIENNFSIGIDLGRSSPLLASRGCPFQCTFCSNPTMWTPTWTARCPSLVVAEMKRQIERYRVTNFDFYDLTAIVKKAWIIEFCQLLIAEKLNVTWQLPSGTRSEALDEETLGWLYRAGCRSVIYAPESGSAPELARIKKKVIIPRMLASMKQANLLGIRMKANIIFGMPGSTWGDVFRTYIFLLRMAWVGVHHVGCFSFSPYPGSEMFRGLLARRRIQLNDDYFIGLNSFSNFLRTESFHEKFSGFQIGLMNFMGMSIFYGSSFVFRPSRMAGVLRSLMAREISSPLARSISNLKRRKLAYRLLEESEQGVIQLPVREKAGSR
jgi:radical SAM superfamily enzyme YgiQ (UPF0313 family)